MDNLKLPQKLSDDTTIVRYYKLKDVRYLFDIKSPTIRLSKGRYYWKNESGMIADNLEFKMRYDVLNHISGTYSVDHAGSIKEFPAVNRTPTEINFGFGHQFISCWSLPYFDSPDAHALATFLGYLDEPAACNKHEDRAILIISTVGQVLNLLNGDEVAEFLPRPFGWQLSHAKCAYYPLFISERDKEKYKVLSDYFPYGFVKSQKYSMQNEYRFIFHSSEYEGEAQRVVFAKEDSFSGCGVVAPREDDFLKEFITPPAQPNLYMNACYINPKLSVDKQQEIYRLITGHSEVEIIHGSSVRPIII